MEIQQSIDAERVVLVLRGDLNHCAHQTFMRVIHSLSPDTRCTIHLDMVASIDSAGLGMLLVLFEQLGSKPKTVLLCNPCRQVAGALRNSNFYALFEIRDDCPMR
ncbi:anti-sigma-factor antagonist [Magnetococcus marinus MC-1]|uniref:Anti-sigma-factor antagonist n=1 Tax=Magnetococcus marinus (strain ATCC BAA-1437 / JCM 17883 / MC-1) TaxID=156889 RepID=A0L9F2_MAGMM|nr:STAS domain-containing protein [Magnetococcus marinus]ABK44595.1 anti-sigma-factor antagonist [Magnetococcus marinus MC-1]